MADYKAAAQRLLRGPRAYRTGTHTQQGDLQDVADAYLNLLELKPAKCYLTEEDPPEEHDLSVFSAVCGKCYAATIDNHGHDKAVANNRIYQLQTMLRKLRDWHKTEYQSNKVLDAEVDAVLNRPETVSRQAKVLDWAVTSFGDVAQNRDERAARLVEEAIEIAQTELVPLEVLKRIADRVYSRPAGTLPQEIGGLGITLDALAENAGLDAQVETEKELARVLALPKDWWQRKHAEKVAAGTADLTVPPVKASAEEEAAREAFGAGEERYPYPSVKPAADQEHKSLHQSGGLGDRTGG